MESFFTPAKPTVPQPNGWRRLLILSMLVALWGATLSIKLRFEPAHYQTVDGTNYSLLAAKIAEGKPYLIPGIENQAGKDFSPYPPGFPALLALAKLASNQPFGQAAILLHMVLFFCLALFCRAVPLSALALVFFSDTAIELATYPWSEFTFVIVLIVMATLASRLRLHLADRPLDFTIAGTFCFAFLVRYAAVFVLVLWCLYALTHWWQGRPGYKAWAKLVGLGVGWVLLWSALEWYLYGQVTGGDRYLNQESNRTLFHQLTTSLADQVLVFKDLSGSSALSFSLGLGCMIAFLLWAFFGKSPAKKTSETATPLFQELAAMGLLYLLFIIPVRWYFYFAEPFDFRLLGPGAILIFLSVSVWFFGRFRIRFQYLFVVCWIALSIFFSLPKAAIFLQYQTNIWLNGR